LVFAHVPVVLLEMKSATQLASRASLEGWPSQLKVIS
jgi:hypothetical protein